MKTIATALGLAEGATEAECLSTLAALKAGSVPKAVTTRRWRSSRPRPASWTVSARRRATPA